MAAPIALQLPKPDAREQLRHRLEQAPLEHAEAVLASFEVLQGLHDQGILELLRGMLGGGDKILEIVVESTRTPVAIRGLRNLLILAKVVGSIDPVLLEQFAKAIPEALSGAAIAERAEPPSVWEMFKILNGKDLRRGLAVVNNLLSAWGRNFSR